VLAISDDHLSIIDPGLIQDVPPNGRLGGKDILREVPKKRRIAVACRFERQISEAANSAIKSEVLSIERPLYERRIRRRRGRQVDIDVRNDRSVFKRALRVSRVD
jgi:hypothetical protein